jgi:tRNA(Glu) U13 pseudouridine synthase TruD
LILQHKGEEEGRVREFLNRSPNDFVGALKEMPWKTLNMYIHAYQSKLWNDTTKRFIGRIKAVPAAGAPQNQKLPVVGFSTEIGNPTVKDIVEQILKEEGVSLQDFIIRAIPDLSSAGTERELYAEIKNLEIGELEDDELNPGKK